jgi:hypothetical protein
MNRNCEVKFEILGVWKSQTNYLRAKIIEITQFSDARALPIVRKDTDDSGLIDYHGSNDSKVDVFVIIHQPYMHGIINMYQERFTSPHHYIHDGQDKYIPLPDRQCVLARMDWHLTESFESLQEEANEKDELHKLHKQEEANTKEQHELYKPDGIEYVKLARKYRHGMHHERLEWLERHTYPTNSDKNHSKEVVELYKSPLEHEYQRKHAEDQMDEHGIIKLTNKKDGTQIYGRIYHNPPARFTNSNEHVGFTQYQVNVISIQPGEKAGETLRDVETVFLRNYREDCCNMKVVSVNRSDGSWENFDDFFVSADEPWCDMKKRLGV